VNPLKIFACDDNGDRDTSIVVELQISPSAINIEYKNLYADGLAMGSIGNDQKFFKQEPAVITIKTMFDGTGAISSLDVNDRIQAIKNVCYNYQGNKHEPYRNVIVWGRFYFKCSLTKLVVTDKLFTPEGDLLRAEIELCFNEYIEKTEEAKLKNQQSPDITHIVQIKAGDHLPLLCKKIYKNSKMFFEIARINKITDFRNLKPGTKIHFPPLK
jgi:hypothetical protein